MLVKRHVFTMSSGYLLHMNNDLYKTLGISRSATAREIKKRYRQLLTTGGESGVTTEQIEAAYQVLSDPLQRTEYDLSLETSPQTTSIKASTCQK